MYGYRCKKVCDCDQGECDPEEGCMCDPGVTGAHCDIGKLATSSPQVLMHDAVSKA